MKYINTIIIEQLSNGQTRLTQETLKEGEGQESAQMRQVLNDFFSTFGQFFSKYDKPVGLITAEYGKLTVME